MTTILALIFLLVVVPVLTAGYLAGQRIVARRKPDPPQIPTQHGLKYETAIFESRDGTHLQGWWIPAAETTTRTVIQCHGQNGSMDPDLVQAKMLHEAGFNVLMFNFRAHGESGGDYVTFGLQEKDDLLGGLDHLRQTRNIQRVGVLGLSMGALTALHAATETSAIACIVADGASGGLHTTLAQWLVSKNIPAIIARPFVWLAVLFAGLIAGQSLGKVSAARWLPHIKNCPILFIHGEHDQFVATAALQRMIRAAPTPTSLWIAPGCRHRQAHQRHPDEYKKRMTGWFDQHLTEDVL